MFLLGLTVGWASDAGYQLILNDKPSNTKVLMRDSQVTVPLYFPVEEEETEWAVHLQKDAKAHQVRARMVRQKRKTRGETPCWSCQANGKCWFDYPPGSGLNWQGAAEYQCNGTGQCTTCSGTGKVETP
jgi:hypothetical protein